MTSSISSRTSSTRYLSRNFLVDITKSLKDDPKLASPDFKVDDFTTFINYFKNADGDVFGVPMEAFVKVYLYRKDLFDDPKNKEAFKAKYGYDLAPAKDHKQYRDIAEFFTQWGKDNDQELWGTTVQAHTGPSGLLVRVLRELIAPTFGVYNWGINPDGWSATVANGGNMNGPKAKAALEYWLGLLKFAPPESTLQHLGRGRGHLRRRPRRAGPGLWRERRLDRHQRRQVQRRRQGRRGPAAAGAWRAGGGRVRQGLYRLL